MIHWLRREKSMGIYAYRKNKIALRGTRDKHPIMFGRMVNAYEYIHNEVILLHVISRVHGLSRIIASITPDNVVTIGGRFPIPGILYKYLDVLFRPFFTEYSQNIVVHYNKEIDKLIITLDGGLTWRTYVGIMKFKEITNA
jgi:hypothetical protein